MPDKSKIKKSFLYRNSLSIVLLVILLVSLCGQIYTGHEEHNNFLNEHNLATVSLGEYLHSGHFLQATFENWESEFLQIALFIVLTAFLRQEGSSESKSIEGREETDREPHASKNSPWAVQQGGFILMVYKHSLSIVLFLLFIFSFIAHWYGSWLDFNLQQSVEGKPQEIFTSYLSNTKFWFESFQNWQSEFLSVLSVVVLTIFLREKGSSQSKPVDAPHKETGG